MDSSARGDALPRADARHELPPEFVAEHKRRRMMAAMAELVSERGYEATKVDEIVSRAKIGRKTFYANFAGKEELFLAAFDETVDEALRRVTEACMTAGPDWEARVEGGLGALLDYVASEPAAARLCLIEALVAGPAAVERYERIVPRFAILLRQNGPADAQLSEEAEETLLGGVAWVIAQHLRRGTGEHLGSLGADLTRFLLAPYLEAMGETVDPPALASDLA